MAQQVAFMHRCDRMNAHHRMSINAVILSLIGRKQMARKPEAFNLWRADDHCGALLIKYAQTDISGATDTGLTLKKWRERSFLAGGRHIQRDWHGAALGKLDVEVIARP